MAHAYRRAPWASSVGRTPVIHQVEDAIDNGSAARAAAGKDRRLWPSSPTTTIHGNINAAATTTTLMIIIIVPWPWPWYGGNMADLDKTLVRR